MALSNDLISQFVKITNDEEPVSTGATVYGSTVEYNGDIYVQIDGSTMLTPVQTTAGVNAGERVTVYIHDHTATITGNISSPSARTDDVKEVANTVEKLVSSGVGDYVTSKEYGEFKYTVETELKQVNDEMLLTFEKTLAEVENVSGDFQSEIDIWSKYIRFVEGDIIIGESGNPLRLHIENDKISYIYGDTISTYFGDKKFVVSSEGSIQRLELGVDNEPYANIYDHNGQLCLSLTRLGVRVGENSYISPYSYKNKYGIGFFMKG